MSAPCITKSRKYNYSYEFPLERFVHNYYVFKLIVLNVINKWLDCQYCIGRKTRLLGAFGIDTSTSLNLLCQYFFFHVYSRLFQTRNSDFLWYRVSKKYIRASCELRLSRCSEFGFENPLHFLNLLTPTLQTDPNQVRDTLGLG